jgi:hypothetical protein
VGGSSDQGGPRPAAGGTVRAQCNGAPQAQRRGCRRARRANQGAPPTPACRRADRPRRRAEARRPQTRQAIVTSGRDAGRGPAEQASACAVEPGRKGLAALSAPAARHEANSWTSPSRCGGVRAGLGASRRRTLKGEQVCPRGVRRRAVPGGCAAVRQCPLHCPRSLASAVPARGATTALAPCQVRFGSTADPDQRRHTLSGLSEWHRRSCEHNGACGQHGDLRSKRERPCVRSRLS